MKIKDFKYFIITDEHSVPMAWPRGDRQLCYCDDEYWLDDISPICIVTRKTAQRQIAMSVEFRTGMRWDIPKYKLMPVSVGRKG
jgi:hypothetical protein